MSVKIYRGFVTGLNEAFVIDEKTKDKLVREDPKSVEIVKPVMRGRFVRRYYAEWGREYVITTFPARKININKYPAIKKHLEKYKSQLLKRAGTQKWFETQSNTAYYKEFEKPKITIKKIVKKPEFWFDCGMFVVDNSIHMILSSDVSLKFLLLLLNTQFIYNVFYWFYSGGEVDGAIALNRLEIIPIRYPQDTKPYEVLADYLLFLNATKEFRTQYKSVIEFFDKQIADSLVYELYFKEIFHKDGLYQEPKPLLLVTASPHLKKIEYDNWARLYWKLQIEKALTKEEINKMKVLEQGNLKTVLEAYEGLSNDSRVLELVRTIKSHKWVRRLEDG